MLPIPLPFSTAGCVYQVLAVLLYGRSCSSNSKQQQAVAGGRRGTSGGGVTVESPGPCSNWGPSSRF